MIKAAANEFDIRAAVTLHEICNIDDIPKSLAHTGIFELFQQRSGKAHMKTSNVFVALEHPGDAIVAPEDLLCLPTLAGIVQGDQISEGLVHVQAQGMINFRHTHCCAESRKTAS